MTSAHVLRESTEQRLRNQIGRVFRGTFGAEQGLCTLVQLATLQMRGNGMSRAAIHAELARLVSTHSEAGTEPAVTVSQVRVHALAASVLRWSDGTRGERVSA
jgi:hypothetical protein